MGVKKEVRDQGVAATTGVASEQCRLLVQITRDLPVMLQLYSFYTRGS